MGILFHTKLLFLGYCYWQIALSPLRFRFDLKVLALNYQNLTETVALAVLPGREDKSQFIRIIKSKIVRRIFYKLSNLLILIRLMGWCRQLCQIRFLGTYYWSLYCFVGQPWYWFFCAKIIDCVLQITYLLS